jgi:hypothetical protein
VRPTVEKNPATNERKFNEKLKKLTKKTVQGLEANGG